MKLFVAALALVCCAQGFAQQEDQPKKKQTPAIANAQSWSFIGLVGGDVRLDENVDGYVEAQTYVNVGLGFGYKSYIVLFERSASETQTGNATLSVTADYTDYVGWVYYRMPQWKMFEFFTGAGVGVYQYEIDSQVYGNVASDKTKSKITGGLSLGIRPIWDPLWLSVELRLRAGEDFMPNPTASFLGRIGFKF